MSQRRPDLPLGLRWPLSGCQRAFREGVFSVAPPPILPTTGTCLGCSFESMVPVQQTRSAPTAPHQGIVSLLDVPACPHRVQVGMGDWACLGPASSCPCAPVLERGEGCPQGRCDKGQHQERTPWAGLGSAECGDICFVAGCAMGCGMLQTFSMFLLQW